MENEILTSMGVLLLELGNVHMTKEQGGYRIKGCYNSEFFLSEHAGFVRVDILNTRTGLTGAIHVRGKNLYESANLNHRAFEMNCFREQGGTTKIEPIDFETTKLYTVLADAIVRGIARKFPQKIEYALADESGVVLSDGNEITYSSKAVFKSSLFKVETAKGKYEVLLSKSLKLVIKPLLTGLGFEYPVVLDLGTGFVIVDRRDQQINMAELQAEVNEISMAVSEADFPEVEEWQV